MTPSAYEELSANGGIAINERGERPTGKLEQEHLPKEPPQPAPVLGLDVAKPVLRQRLLDGQVEKDDLADVPAIAVKTLPQPVPGLALLGREPPGLVRDPALRREAIAAYQACVSFADAQVGAVLDALDRSGGWQDTVLVLVGDNGFHLGEHGGLLRKDTLFEEALRVPLLVAAPGLPHPGAVVRAPVELLDVYPTIVELAGLAPASDLDGQSLVPLLENPGGTGRGVARSWRRVQPPERGVSLRSERFRYTLWPDGSEELYDRRSRAPESENLARRPEWSAEKARVRARLEALVAPPAVSGSPPG